METDNQKVLLQWFDRRGVKRTATASNEQEAIKKFIAAREDMGANWRTWSFDGGKTWTKY